MPSVIAIDDFVTDPAPMNLGRSLAESSAEIARAEDRLVAQRQRFAEFYQAVQEENSQDLDALAKSLLLTEKAHAAILLPVIEDAERRLKMYRGQAHAGDQKAIVRLMQRAHEYAASWLENIRDFRLKVEMLAGEKEVGEEPPSEVFDNSADAMAYLRKIVAG